MKTRRNPKTLHAPDEPVRRCPQKGPGVRTATDDGVSPDKRVSALMLPVHAAPQTLERVEDRRRSTRQNGDEGCHPVQENGGKAKEGKRTNGRQKRAEVCG
jgi:hypothetical protein